MTFGHNYMTASVQVFADETNTKPTLQELMDALAGAGVTTGIDDAALEKAIDAAFGKSTIVATGKKPKEGVDGLIHLRETLSKKAPKQLKDGRVDFRDLQLVKNVVRGQILAEKEPPIPGLPGADVRGVPIEAPAVKDPVLAGGQNTAVTPDGTKLLSLIDGHLEIQKAANGQPIPGVSDTFVLKKNVDIETGNIDCIGNCLVAGSVADGFKVVANGDVRIKGLVEGAEIISRNGNIFLERGVRGLNHGKVAAGKGIAARFAENALLEAEGDIVVAEHIYHSKLRAGKSVRVTGTPGVVMGGEVAFREKLECREAGSEAGPKTLLYFGDPRAAGAAKRMIEIDEVLADLETQMDAMREDLKKMRRLTLEDPEKHKPEIDELARLSAPFPNLKERAEALLVEKKALEPHMQRQASDPVAEIPGNVFPGVILRGEDVEEAFIKTQRRGLKITLSPREKGVLSHFVFKGPR